ncbi:MAG: hypothetical protein CL681_17555 [Blastopirellula sp.]|nr:hypothetical protein [Blastopirellula sp.]
MVALTIFSGAIIALYGWYDAVLSSMIRAEERLEVITFSKNFNSYVVMMNLRQESSGEYRSNGFLARWNAKLIEGKKEGRTLIGALGHYRLGLYRIEALVFDEESGRDIEVLITRSVGYEGVRLPSTGL